MKYSMKIIIVLLSVCLIISCSSKENNQANYKEKQLSFLSLKTELNNYKLNSSFQNVKVTDNIWIKKSENILMLHETFKKIGYEKILTQSIWSSNPFLEFSYINKSIENIVDSLESTYANFQDSPKYYKEFWLRRYSENNEKETYKVLNEVKQIMFEKKQIDIYDELVNDTLQVLLSFEYPKRQITNEIANEHLEYLINIGLHQSAFNIISGEVYKYSEIKWKRSKKGLIQQLRKSESHQNPWFADDTK